MACLSEVAMSPDAVYFESSFRRGLCVLSERRSHLGKKGSPKRDDVLQPLFHTRSGEVG